MSLARRTFFAFAWNFIEQLLRRFLSVLVTLILAIFLLPDDFGVVAMMAVFLAIGQSLMNSGFSQALIRMKNPLDSDLSTAFYCNLLLSVISYSILFFIAPLVANFYQEPSLELMIRVAALSIVVNSFQVVQVAIMSRMLNFRIQVRASVPASVISGGVAIYLASSGFSAWSLIFQMLIASIVQSVIIWVAQGWRPSLVFDVSAAIKMYSFGYKLFIAAVIDIAFRNIYVIVIAKIFSASIAGIFYFADRLKEGVINQLVNSIQVVSYPSLATLQDNVSELKSAFRRLVCITNFVFLPILALLIVSARMIFETFLDERWLPGAAQFQIMCLSSVLYPMHSVNLNILKVRARSDLFLRLEIFKKIMVCLILFLTYRHGVYAILLGQLFASLISYLPNSYYSKEMIDYGVLEQVKDFFPSFICSALALFFGFFVVNIFNAYHGLIALSLLTVSMCFFYLAVSCFFNRDAYYLLKKQFKKI